VSESRRGAGRKADGAGSQSQRQSVPNAESPPLTPAQQPEFPRLHFAGKARPKISAVSVIPAQNGTPYSARIQCNLRLGKRGSISVNRASEHPPFLPRLKLGKAHSKTRSPFQTSKATSAPATMAAVETQYPHLTNFA